MVTPGLRREDSIGFHGSLTQKAIFAALERRLKSTGVSPVQFIALGHLMSSEPMNQSSLADDLFITGATAVRLVDRMERDGLVTREPDAKDGRIKWLVPTAKAIALWEEIGHVGPEVLEEAYGGIEPGELEMVKRVLARVRGNLGFTLADGPWVAGE